MDATVLSLFGLYVLTPGRRLFALGQVRSRAVDAGLDRLLEPIAVAEAHDREIRRLDRVRKIGRRGVSVADKDHSVDRALAMLHKLLAYNAGSGDPRAEALLAELFPLGLRAHTHLAHVEQFSANEQVLDTLAEASLQPWLVARGIAPLVEDLADAHAEFDAALAAAHRDDLPTWEEIKAGRRQGQALYLEVIAEILSATRDAPELRAALLEPILIQDRTARAFRRKRRAPTEIEPDETPSEPAGDPTEPSSEASDAA